MDQKEADKLYKAIRRAVGDACDDACDKAFEAANAAVESPPAKPEVPEPEWTIEPGTGGHFIRRRGSGPACDQPVVCGIYTPSDAALIANDLNAGPAMLAVCEQATRSIVDMGSLIGKAKAALALQVYGPDGKRTDVAE